MVAFLSPLYWIGSTAFKPRSLATTVPPTVFFQPEITPFIKLFTKRVQLTKPVDPALLDMAGGFDCLGFPVAKSAQASNLVAGQFFLLGRYQQAAPPSAVVD